MSTIHFILTSLLIPLFLFFPADSYAQGIFTVENALQVVSRNLNRIIPFLVLIATVVFLGGIVSYVTAGGDENRMERARGFIIYGIIGLAIIIAIWGFVNIVIDFIFGARAIPNIPGGNVVKPL